MGRKLIIAVIIIILVLMVTGGIFFMISSVYSAVNINGIVLDEETEKPLENVAVIAESRFSFLDSSHKEYLVLLTDKGGKFKGQLKYNKLSFVDHQLDYISTNYPGYYREVIDYYKYYPEIIKNNENEGIEFQIKAGRPLYPVYEPLIVNVPATKGKLVKLIDNHTLTIFTDKLQGSCKDELLNCTKPYLEFLGNGGWIYIDVGNKSRKNPYEILAETPEISPLEGYFNRAYIHGIENYFFRTPDGKAYGKMYIRPLVYGNSSINAWTEDIEDVFTFEIMYILNPDYKNLFINPSYYWREEQLRREAIEER